MFDGEIQHYRSQQFGDDAQFIVTDARSFRDEGLPDVVDIANPLEVGGFLIASFDPTRSMLGDQQLDDLKADLLAADQAGVTWKFVNISEPVQNLGVLAASDRYEGYAAERAELLGFIEEHEIQNVVFVAADIHGTLINNVTYQETVFGPQIATGAIEVTTGSVAYHAPFGQTVADLAEQVGLLDAFGKAFYESLPIAPDADGVVNDRDDFIKALVNDGLDDLGYDRLGLDDNLAIADGRFDAELTQGGYVATHTYGWTEFDIDADTQQLTVTTFGIEAYTAAELATMSQEIIAQEPQVVSQFVLTPTAVLNGSDGDDVLIGAGYADQINSMAGDDIANGGAANDRFESTAGNDIFIGGEGLHDIAIFSGNAADYSVTMMTATEISLYNQFLAVEGLTLDLSLPVLRVTGMTDVTEAADGNDVVQVETLHFPDLTVSVTDNGLDLSDGDNTFNGGGRADMVNGGSGDDIINGNGGDDIIRDGSGDDQIDGGNGDDLLFGSEGVDSLFGRAGNDILTGAGGDSISGGSDDDILVAWTTGEAGDVTAFGGSGADTFALFDSEGAGLDVGLLIIDFTQGEDSIDLSGLRSGDGSALTFADLAITPDGFGGVDIDLSGFTTAGGAAVTGGLSVVEVGGADLASSDFVFAGTDFDALLGVI